MQNVEIYNLIIDFLGILSMEFVCVKTCKILTNEKTNRILINLIWFIIISLFLYINSVYNYTFSKFFVSFFIYVILNFLVFSLMSLKLIVSTFVFYLIGCFNEIIYTLIVINEFTDIQKFINNHTLKFLFTILVCLTTYLIIMIIKRKYITKIRKNIIYENHKLILTLMTLSLFLMSSIIFKHLFSLTLTEYILNVIILIIIFIFGFLILVQYLKVKRAEEKEIILMEFMKEYEKIIDSDRINRHEMLNNLLIIKSLIENKKRMEETLHEIIKTYESNSKKCITDLYKLPSGLRGLVYYKIYNLQLNQIKPNIFISQEAINKIDNLENKVYLKIYKIIGILLDNAIEACVTSKKKFLILDIYQEKGKLFFYIENSMRDKVKIKEIYKRGYTTKGKKRGMGLYIVNNIINLSKTINLVQKINKSNNFVSIVQINTK